MDETKQELQDYTTAIHERMASLDAPVRELILSNDYVITLSDIIKAHSLGQKEAAVTEEITTNFLLGTIRPKELEQIYIEELSSLTKENIQSIYNDIKTKILAPVWDIVESAWNEDDANEALFNEVIELAEVPLPPNLQKQGVQTLGQKIEKELDFKEKMAALNQKPNTENQEQPIQKTAVQSPSWEEKMAQQKNDLTIETRIIKDKTVPKIGNTSTDPYRETPE